MSWSATLVDVQQGDRWYYRIVYTDGMHKTDVTYPVDNISDATVQATARSEVARLSQVTGSVGKLSIQVGQQIDLTPPVEVVVPSDPAQLARQQYNVAVQTYRVLLDQTALGLPVDPAATAAAQKSVQALWLDNYAGAG